MKTVLSKCCSVDKSCPSLWPHRLQHISLPCPPLSPRLGSNTCPLSWCCYLTISSSVNSSSSFPQSFPASESFPMSWLFLSGGQSIGVSASASASVLPINIQGWFPCSPRDSQESSPAPQVKSINSSVLSVLYGSALTPICDWIYPRDMGMVPHVEIN